MNKIFIIILTSIFVFIFFVGSLLHLHPFNFENSLTIDELFQDVVEQKIGIERMIDIANKSEETIQWFHLNLYNSKSIDVYSLGLNKEENYFTIGFPGRLFFLRGYTSGKEHKPDNFHQWNSSLFGISYSLFNNVYYRWHILLFITLPIIVLTCLNLWNLKNFNPSISWCKINFVMTFVIISLWMIAFFYHTPHFRNYTTSYLNLYYLLKENHEKIESIYATNQFGFHRLEFLEDHLDKNFKSIDVYSLFPSGKQERNIHKGAIFFGTEPVFDKSFIRINIDLFNYIYYAPFMDENDFNTLNPQLKITNLGDGFWLGQYQKYINEIYLLIWSYYFAFLLCIINVIISIRIYRNTMRTAI